VQNLRESVVNSYQGDFAYCSPFEDQMPYPAMAVANEFLTISKAAGRDDLTPMKLQKLVYFAHGWCLALTEQPLICERIEAWQYGPVIPALYHEFKYSGNDVISGLGTAVKYANGRIAFEKPTLDDYPDDVERRNAKGIIGRVFELYGKYSAARLSNATHMEGTPWQLVYKEGVRSAVIPDDTIKSFFRSQVQGHAGA
jgi:uncharacterized phage-associated protein